VIVQADRDYLRTRDGLTSSLKKGMILTGSFCIQQVVDSVIAEPNSQLLNLSSSSMLVVLVFQGVFNIGQSLLLTAP
jgi:hypothetical protein